MTADEAIAEITARLAAAVPPGSKVILFGSRARGDARERSDYDILVLEPEVQSMLEEWRRLSGILRDLRIGFDLVVLDEATANRRATVPGTMESHAYREGRILVS